LQIVQFTIKYSQTNAAGPFGVIVLTNIPVLSTSIFTSSMENPKPRSP